MLNELSIVFRVSLLSKSTGNFTCKILKSSLVSAINPSVEISSVQTDNWYKGFIKSIAKWLYLFSLRCFAAPRLVS